MEIIVFLSIVIAVVAVIVVVAGHLAVLFQFGPVVLAVLSLVWT